MPFSITTILAPAHLLFFSTLLGTELYQSFVMTKVAYLALPRSAFTSLQKQAFPIYFKLQSLLLLFVVATTPPLGPLSLLRRKREWIPFVIAGTTALLNLFIFGPRTKDLMIQRVHQATRDANMQLGAGIISEDMKKLNKFFSKAHAMSIHLNLLTIGGTLWYGWQLASKIKFGAA